jgi:sugar phosphate isomerase/epimerase
LVAIEILLRLLGELSYMDGSQLILQYAVAGLSMTRPEIGLSMLYCLDQPFGKLVEEIPRTNVTCLEIVDEGLHALDKRKVSVLKSLEKSYKVKYTVHAPFAGINIALSSRPLLTATLKRLKKSIAHACALDSKLWVFHPGFMTGVSSHYPSLDWKTNLQSVRLLFKFAWDCGLETAIENLANPSLLKNTDDFERFYNEVDEPIGLALDTGHANLVGPADSFLRRFPDRIVHIHAHDNDGQSDQHLGIGYGNIDWKCFAGLLKKAGFGRLVIIESTEHVLESMQRMKQLLS